MFAEWPLNIYPSPSNVESKVLENISGKYLIFAQYLVNIVLFCGAQCRNSGVRGGEGESESEKHGEPRNQVPEEGSESEEG